MATAWVKSLYCRSTAADDVVVHHQNPKPLLPISSNCRHTAVSIKDAIETAKVRPRKPKKPPLSPPSRKSNLKHRRTTKSEENPNNSTRTRFRGSDPFVPALTELPEGHPSRNVVEIIFHTNWSPKAFTGRVEMIFKVQNGSQTAVRFEEYRETVKKRAGSGGLTGSGDWEENARCAADGNEMMRFQCLRPTSSGGAYDARVSVWAFRSGKGGAICTYAGSGEAHGSAGGGRGRRRAMLVCRVIAGRVSRQMEIDSLLNDRVGFDSVSGNNGELLMFDTRAVMPCFLIIYKL